MIRVAGPGHCEDRTVSVGCNPYLGLAALLSAGLDGIHLRLDPGPHNLGNMYERTLDDIRAARIRLLPQSLHDAVGELEQDEIIRGALGVLADDFNDLKTKEWEKYDGQVRPWEVRQYLTWF